jgi:hypothetical protein
MDILGPLGAVHTWWAAYYGDHQMVSVAVRYLHLAGILIGGGTALSTDRELLGAARINDEDCRRAALSVLQGSHAIVVPALTVVIASGVLMASADWSTFLASRLFWFKMVFVGLLLANGAGLVAAEKAYALRGQVGVWRRLVAASGASFLLWLIILWMGAWLTVAA